MLQDAIDAFEKDEYNKAFELFFELARYSKNEDAMLYLGIMYYEGYFVDKDVHEATYWWKEASRRGNLDAKFRLESINMSTITKF